MNVMVFGTFDYFHAGHAFVIGEALKRGSTTVIVARDLNVKMIKRRFPRQAEQLRCDAIAKQFPNARVHLGDPDDFLSPIRTYKPDLILMGYDQKLPPGVTEDMLTVRIERLPPHQPERFKSSLRRD